MKPAPNFIVLLFVLVQQQHPQILVKFNKLTSFFAQNICIVYNY